MVLCPGVELDVTLVCRDIRSGFDSVLIGVHVRSSVDLYVWVVTGLDEFPELDPPSYRIFISIDLCQKCIHGVSAINWWFKEGYQLTSTGRSVGFLRALPEALEEIVFKNHLLCYVTRSLYPQVRQNVSVGLVQVFRGLNCSLSLIKADMGDVFEGIQGGGRDHNG